MIQLFLLLEINSRSQPLQLYSSIMKSHPDLIRFLNNYPTKQQNQIHFQQQLSHSKFFHMEQ